MDLDNYPNIKTKIQSLKKTKKKVLLAAGLSFLLLIIAMASPESNKKETISPVNNFSVKIDSLVKKEPNDFFFSKKSEKDKKIRNSKNPFKKDEKKEAEKSVFDKIDTKAKKKKKKKTDIYNNEDEDLWESLKDKEPSSIQKEVVIKKQEPIEEENPFAFYESETMSSRVDIKKDDIEGFKNLIKVETSGLQIVSEQNPYLRFRLLEDFSFNGNIIPKNTYLMANASFSGNRVYFDTNSVQLKSKILDVQMSIYDTYGNKGLELTKGKSTQVQGEINRELNSEYNKNLQRGSGIIRGILKRKPKLEIDNKVLLLRIHKIK